MTAPADPQLLLDQAVSRLTGPGGPFEIVEEEVLGTVMPVMKNRGHAIGELISASRAWGDGDYLVTSDRRISFTEHADSVAALATALRGKYGVRKGDRVGILAANTPEWVMTFFATQALGAIAVGLNGWWVPREVTHGIELSRPKVLVVDAKRGAALPELPADITVLTMEEDLPALIAEYAGSDVPSTDIDEDDPAVILFTSGTSGRPKGALHSHRNVMAVVDYHKYSDAIGAAFTGREYDASKPSPLRYLLTSPLFHIASLHNLVVPRLATGSAVILTEGGFDVDKVLGLVERERVTNWGAVPTMASRLLEHGNIAKYDVSSLTAFSLASAPSSPAFKERLKEQVPFARLWSTATASPNAAPPLRSPSAPNSKSSQALSGVRSSPSRWRFAIPSANGCRTASKVKCAYAAPSSCSDTGRTTRRPSRQLPPDAGSAPAISA